ncbi:hypothetical protein R6Q59_013325 [Mikania micrantha]
MPGSHDTRGHRGSRGHVPFLRDAPNMRKYVDSSPTKRDAGLRKYTCGRYTRWCKPLSRSSSRSRMSAGDGICDTLETQFNNQRLALICDDEDVGYHSESNADTDNRNDIPHDRFQRESNYGGRSHGNSQNLNDASRDTSQCNSIYGGQSHGTSQRPSIARMGDKFASYDIHHTICTIMREHLTKPWITFRMVPNGVRRNMYNCFKTRWSMNLESEQINFEAFINVLKDRYSDMMYHMKVTSARIARNAGCDIAIND